MLGMTIPREFGGGGLGITSYNRVLERIGRTCGSTAVMVSAHQSIGCKAIMLFGTEEQKSPLAAACWRRIGCRAFCLSEPNVGCDAGGQETRCELSDDGQYYILNGEKKWSTSGALAGLFTVMAKQKLTDPKTGKTGEKVTALVCTPDMPGIDIFQKNRSKCGIRGTWQARIRFNDVKVPASHLLHQEGKGLNVALTCLNYGRCTLSAGCSAAHAGPSSNPPNGRRRASSSSARWRISSWCRRRSPAWRRYTYAMDAVLYMTTGMLDRHDEDIMLETAICKVFCSEMGWRVVNDAMQIMGGEGYMTENEIERIFRDSRINLIVEGANEVMQSFIFAYGGKQLAEKMLGVQQAVGWDHDESPTHNLARILRGLKQPGVLQGRGAAGRGTVPGHRAACAGDSQRRSVAAASTPTACAAGSRAQPPVQARQQALRRADRLAAGGAGAAGRQRHVAARLGLHAEQAGSRSAQPAMHGDAHSSAIRRRRFISWTWPSAKFSDCFRDLFDNDDDAMRSAAEAALRIQRHAAQRSVRDSRSIAECAGHRASAAIGRNQAVSRRRSPARQSAAERQRWRSSRYECPMRTAMRRGLIGGAACPERRSIKAKVEYLQILDENGAARCRTGRGTRSAMPTCRSCTSR